MAPRPGNSGRPWLRVDLPLEERVESLLAEMTLAEKVGQTHQIHNLDPSLDHELIGSGGIGSSLIASGATAGNKRDEGVRVCAVNAAQRSCPRVTPGHPSAVRAGCHPRAPDSLPDPARAGRRMGRGPRTPFGAGRRGRGERGRSHLDVRPDAGHLRRTPMGPGSRVAGRGSGPCRPTRRGNGQRLPGRAPWRPWHGRSVREALCRLRTGRRRAGL